MGRRKLTPNVILNNLESMIEYRLILSIFYRICEMTKIPLKYPRDDTKLNPLQHLFKIIRWGTKWKMVINKTNEWVGW
jgi:hypothetical protein